MTTTRRSRERSIEALLDAAERLFVENGPSSVSLRDVAREAGVNHGLIHHYIGSRDDLLVAVFNRVEERATLTVADVDDASEALARLRALGGARDSYTRLLAWAILEGRRPTEFHGRSIALRTIMESIGREDREFRLALAAAMIETLGVKLFGEYALLAVGLESCDFDELRESMDASLQQTFHKVGIVG